MQGTPSKTLEDDINLGDLDCYYMQKEELPDLMPYHDQITPLQDYISKITRFTDS